MSVEFVGLDKLIPPELLSKLSEAAVMEVLQDIADAARHEWVMTAQKELSSTRQDYINGIQPVMYQPGMATISLVGVLPNLIENGMDEKDMHETLLGPGVPVAPVGQPGKRESKDGGYYRSIPFRHTTPGSGSTVGTPMGRPYRGHEAVADAKKLGRQIYAAAKELSPTTSQPGEKTKYGGRLPAGLAPKLRAHHATDISAGMVRAEKKYKTATQSQYMTFRTIAVGPDGSPRGGSPWLRPATPGRDFAQQVMVFVQKIAPAAFAAYLEGQG